MKRFVPVIIKDYIKNLLAKFSRNQFANYYFENQSEFKTDLPHDIFIKKFLSVITPSQKVGKQIIGIDVGCNTGDYISILKSICSEPKSEILCFEPNPVNLPIIKEKIKPMTAVKLFNCAISNFSSFANFYNWKAYKSDDEGNQVGGLRAGGEFLCKVEVKTLSEVLKEEYNLENIIIKFLKIDVEGNDTNVIKGLGENLSLCEYIVFECSDCLDDHRGPGIKNPMKDIVDYLSLKGFDTYRIGSKKLLRVNDYYWDYTYEKYKFWSNCFALKKEDQLIKSIINNNFDYII